MDILGLWLLTILITDSVHSFINELCPRAQEADFTWLLSPSNSNTQRVSIDSDINQTSTFCQLTNQLIDLSVQWHTQCAHTYTVHGWEKEALCPICLHLFAFSTETLAGFFMSADVQYMCYIVRCSFPKRPLGGGFLCFLILNKIKSQLLGGLMLKSHEGRAQSSSRLVSAAELKRPKKQYNCNKCMFNY